MNVLLILCLIFVAIYSCVSWLLPALLSWLFKRKYHINLKIGRIAVLKLILKDVSLSKDRYFVHIDEISFRSSFFNSEINKLVWVVIKGVEVTNNVEAKRSVVVETILKPLLSKQNSLNKESVDDEVASFRSLSSGLNRLTQRKLLDFRDKKLPPSLIMFAQFMGVHIFNASVTLRDGALSNGSINITASEVHADGAAGGPARALVFSANLVQLCARVYKETKCLGEASCSLLIEGTVKADGPLNVEKIHTAINNTTVSFQDELYQFVQKQKKYRPASVRKDVISEDHIATIIPRLSPVIPKIFSLKIDTTTFKCIDKVTKTDFKMSIQSLHVNSRFSASSLADACASGVPQVYVAFQTDQFCFAADNEPLFSINKIKLDAKLEKGVLNLYLIVSTLHIMYDHGQVFGWYASMAERDVPAPLYLGEADSSSWSETSLLSRALASCVVQGCAEVRSVRARARLAPARLLAAGCGGIKVKLDQLLETRDEPYQWAVARLVVGRRHWSAELLVDGGWAAAGAAGGWPAPPPTRKHHAWGSALLAVALVKWGSHGPTDSKVEAMMDCLRLEWSADIAASIITLASCIAQYRPQRPPAPPPAPAQEEGPCSVAVNVALSHINLFFILEPSICLMTRVDAVTLEKTNSKSGAVVSGFKVVDMVPYKATPAPARGESPCSVAVNVALFHINLFFILGPSICLMTRVDAVTLEKTNSKSGAVVSGFKVVDMVPYKGECDLVLAICFSLATPAPAQGEGPCSVAVNVALSHINLFFILEPSICLMIRVDAVTLEKTNSKSGAVVSGFKVVDMVPYKGECDLVLAICFSLAIPAPAQGEGPCSVAVNVALFHINLFFILEPSICLMTRVDAVTLEKTNSKSGAVVSGFKVVDMVPYKGNFHCQRSDEINSSIVYVQLARIEHVPSKTRNSALLDFQFLENVDMEWSANLHLKILTLVREIKSFREELRSKRQVSPSSSMEQKKSERALDWQVSFKAETNLELLLSKENHMLFTTDDMTVAYDHETGLSILWSQLRMVLNGDELVTVQGYKMARATDDPDVRLERSANEGLTLPWNKVWAVNVESVRIIFPYKHRFADAVQGDFVSLFKWIKLVHNIQKKPFTADSPLPSDLHIKIEDILIEMSDDPFEVKLRDNYELLEDEYKESQKRRTMLDAKVQELCKPHLFLPAGKVEELYAALRQKDAQIYVQRCRAAPPPRSRLVACCVGGLRLVALADPALHGAANASARRRDMDGDSPWPEDGIEFTTLWCRAVSVSCAQWQILLRDFPQPLLSMSELRLWGTLLGAEEQAPPRALRTVVIDQGDGWGECELERSMMPLKWYHDLCCEMAQFSYAFGPCWEPVIAQCNLAFDQVSRASLDPSAPLAWWDKVRLLVHGRLTAHCQRMTCLLHVSLDPYNTTEEMELTWSELVLDWTNGKLGFLGELNVFVRTASKYDDCRVLRVPSLRLSVKLGWQCVGDPRDHHAVAPCAPTRLPEYSSNQEHDSYRAFRSQGLDLHLSMETKPIDRDGPVLLLYGSTLRWFESLKLILSGVTRPTRRGRVFSNVRPRKLQLSRHYRNVSVSLTLHNLQVFYWSSSSMQRGIEMVCARVTCGSRHRLALVAASDGLVRRPRAHWATLYMNCDLNDAEIWLKTTAPPADKDENSVLRPPAVEKWYCVSVRRVSYGREASGAVGGSGSGGAGAATHRLAVHDLRGAWTKLNRDLAFALIDTYIKTQQLKKNLSTKALKEEEKLNTSPKHQREADVVSPPPAAQCQASSTSSGAAGGEGSAGGMLAALVAEAGGEAPVVFSDELGDAPAHAPASKHALDDDNAHTACLIELVNSQVVLKGCETRGYVLLCAARAEVRQRVRRSPAAVAWSGSLSAMQYYATVSAADRDQLLENIQWVSVEEISERWAGAEISALPDVPRLVGSGHSAGGVIGRTVGPGADTGLAQLQRIVSRCACEFYYLSHEEAEQAAGGDGWGATQQPYDSFMLMHHDLDVCTNSLQYAMLLDVVNNVVLHVEPERRRTLERRARMRFQLQLHRDTDPRHLIHKLQTQVRESLARLRRLEKEYYLKNRSITGDDPVAIEELKSLDNQVNECKEVVWSLGEELDAMVRAWREAAGSGARGAGAARVGAAAAGAPHRYNEICFKSARWRLTDADGQLGIADLLLTNFLYTKTSRSDDSVEHQLEVGYVRVTNLLPNEPFPEVLVPQAPCGRAPLARRAALRVFCRDRPPVGGIAVKEHFEVNIVPIRIGLTKKFFNTMLKFCFPERDPDTMEDGDEEGEGARGGSGGTLVPAPSKKVKKSRKDSNSNFYVKRDKKDKDDVEKMKERAEKNKLFIYIKIPEVPVRVSYKGSKEKNLEDVRDLPLVLPTLEYHNVTWTWLDLLLATKSDTRRVILSQAIRQKLQLHRRAAAAPEPLEEDKARLLLGERMVTENKPQKKSTPSVFKFSKS